jgi:hypothetical protein
MDKFKIEYEPDLVSRYMIYRLEHTWISSSWKRIASFNTEEEAEAAVKILRNYPKYF